MLVLSRLTCSSVCRKSPHGMALNAHREQSQTPLGCPCYQEQMWDISSSVCSCTRRSHACPCRQLLRVHGISTLSYPECTAYMPHVLIGEQRKSDDNSVPCGCR